jgi:hypothetical protein
MRRMILGTVATAMMTRGVSAMSFAAPISQPHGSAGFNSGAAHAQKADYYWNHRHYEHRDWDRHHHYYHYY